MTQFGTKKSRRGCAHCKRRRVKCDEQAPCRNCVRRNEHCNLLEITPSSSSENNESALPASSEEWIQDLELMHHFDTNTSIAPLGIRKKVQDLWRHYVPQQAMKHHFLMHGLLALSALHIAYLRPDESTKYLQLCDKHQTIALRKFRTILSTDISADVADALFALASTISLSSMARSTVVAEAMTPPKAMAIDDITELISLTRGVRDVISVTYDYVNQGPMRTMFSGHLYPTGTQVKLPQSAALQFVALREMLTDSDLDSESMSHCLSALEHLEDVYRNIVYWASMGDLETGQVWVWAAKISTEFLQLAQTNSAPALVILAYFGAATMAIRTVWCATKWGIYAIEGVAQALKQDMQQWVEWPRCHALSNMAILGVETRRPVSYLPETMDES